jgi:hypothetical protein
LKLSTALFFNVSDSLRKKFAAYHIPLHPLEATWKRKGASLGECLSGPRRKKRKESGTKWYGARDTRLEAQANTPLADTLAKL